MTRALVVTGAGRYADPWHDFPATTARVVAALAEAGIATDTTEDVEGILAAPPADAVLVLNFGNPAVEQRDAAAERRAVEGADAHVRAGGGLVALHVASTAMTSSPLWSELLGGRWVRGVTMHPDFGPARIRVRTGAHPIVEGVADFTTADERYTRLHVEPGVEALAWHEHEGADHPLLWARERGSGRVVYDALGHASESYDVAEARLLLTRAVAWAGGTTR